MAIKLHFLNVGDGDCTIVEFPSGRVMMVDINNSKALDSQSEDELREHFQIDQSAYKLNKILGIDTFAEKGYSIKLTDPVDYYKTILGKKALFRFVCTHPDMDHLSGLYRLHKEEQIHILNLWDSDHSFDKTDEEFNNQTRYDKRDWDTYKELRSSKSMPRVLWLERHAKAEFYHDDGIYLLASTKELKKQAQEKDDPNNLSYVLMLQHGNFKAILGGDAPVEVWEDILSEFGDEFLKVDVLKASHHGRDSGYHDKAVKAMNPTLTIVSVGKKPDTDASNKYRQYSSNVWSTRWKGTIVLTCHEDGRFTYAVENDS